MYFVSISTLVTLCRHFKECLIILAERFTHTGRSVAVRSGDDYSKLLLLVQWRCSIRYISFLRLYSISFSLSYPRFYGGDNQVHLFVPISENETVANRPRHLIEMQACTTRKNEGRPYLLGGQTSYKEGNTDTRTRTIITGVWQK